MKTTRLLLAFAAALSLGLAVFANVRTNHNAVASAQSTSNASDDLADSPSGADNSVSVTGTKVADDTTVCLTGATGVQVADDTTVCLTGTTGVQVADDTTVCLTGATGIQVADDTTVCLTGDASEAITA